MIDTHAHLNFKAFAHDWREVANRAVAQGVQAMIIVGTDVATSIRAVELAKTHPNLYAAVGVHPHHARELEPSLTEIEALLTEPKVVAIGEVGLDRHLYKQTQYGDTKPDEIERLYTCQKQVFSQEIALATKYDKPLIIHSWEAGGDVLALLPPGIRGVFHCFDGSKKYLKRVLEAGLYVSFTGNITFSQDRLEVANMVPLDRLLLETDSPYMTPNPIRGERNEPANTRLIAKMHAASRGLKAEAIEETTTENAKRLFNL